MKLRKKIKFSDGRTSDQEAYDTCAERISIALADQAASDMVAAFGVRYGGVAKVVVTDGDGDKWVFKPKTGA